MRACKIVIVASILNLAVCGLRATATEPVSSSGLAVGVASVEITPPVGYRMAGYYGERLSTGTHDPLQAKALVFRQGSKQAAMVYCDLVGVPRTMTSRARAEASAATGIPVECISVAATHSHTGPLYFGILHDELHDRAVASDGRDLRETVDYVAWLAARIAEVVSAAQRAVQPARLRAGTVPVNGIAFNRRFHMKDGSVRFNPGALNPDIVRPAGPIDPEAGVVWIEPAAGGRPFAGLTVFALHLDTLGGTEYAADFPAILQTALKEVQGTGFISLFGAGTCGDINHVDVTRRERIKTEEIGRRLADSVLAGREATTLVSSPALDVRSRIVTCDVQRPTPDVLAEARSKADRVISGNLPFLERVQLCKILDLARNYPEPTRGMEVQAIRLGPDLALVTLPGEIFVELGLAIKHQSPFKTTLVIELANDCPNYVPTEKAFTEGSYETINSRLAPGSGERLVASAVAMLKELATPLSAATHR